MKKSFICLSALLLIAAAHAAPATNPNTIQVLRPNGGGIYCAGDTMLVMWQADTSAFSAGAVVQISTDGGKSYWTMHQGPSILPGNTAWGALSWRIPDSLGGEPVVSDSCFIRIYEYANESVEDISDSAFSIMQPLWLNHPIGGEIFSPGDEIEIRWGVQDSAVQAIRIQKIAIDFSSDSGNSWQQIGSRMAFQKVFVWNIQDSIDDKSVVSDNCRISLRFQYFNPEQIMGGYVEARITSNASFAIREGPIRLVSPDGLERYYVGDTMDIQWVINKGSYDCIQVLFSADYGLTWNYLHDVICAQPSFSDSNRYSFEWVIPDTIDIPHVTYAPTISNGCRIRIQSANDETIYDVSRFAFSILDSSARDSVSPDYDPFYDPDAPAPSPTEVTFNLKARVTVTGRQLREFLDQSGTVPNAKLAFVNRGAIYYVDFSETSTDTPLIHVMKHCGLGGIPVISPDGNSVAFVTSGNTSSDDMIGSCATRHLHKVWMAELAEDAKPVKVADPGYVPRFIQNAANPTIIYSTCGDNGGNSGYTWDGCGKVVKKEIIGGTVQAEQVVYDGGSYFGGLSWDERYLGHAQCNLGAFMLDLQNPSAGPDTLNNFPVKTVRGDTSTHFMSQSGFCSISSSRIFTNAMMYLDCGSSSYYHEVLGKWEWRKRIFISRIDGKVLKFFDTPEEPARPDTVVEGMATQNQWGYPQWSNHPHFAVVDLRMYRYFSNHDNNMRSEQLFIINLKDSTFLRIVETTDSSYSSTTDMYHPSLWVQVPDGFAEDSTWLKYAFGERPAFSAGDIRAPALSGIQFRNGLITAETLIQNISVYRIDGRLVCRITPHRSLRENLAAQSRIPAGFHIVRVATEDGRQKVFRWMVVKP